MLFASSTSVNPPKAPESGGRELQLPLLLWHRTGLVALTLQSPRTQRLKASL